MSVVNIDPYIMDVLIRDLVGHFNKPSSFIVFMFVWYKTKQSKDKKVKLSLSTIAEGCGLSKSSVQIGLRYLKGRKLIVTKKAYETDIPIYSINDYWNKRKQLKN